MSVDDEIGRAAFAFKMNRATLCVCTLEQHIRNQELEIDLLKRVALALVSRVPTQRAALTQQDLYDADNSYRLSIVADGTVFTVAAVVRDDKPDDES